MKVKVYREPENEGLILDDVQLSEYHALTSKLGLQNEHKQKKPNVYLPINSAMEKMLKALCPSVVSAEKYTYSTIPLEVLQVLDFAKEQEMFDGFYVWYANQNPDPLLIGWKWQDEEAKEKKYTWKIDSFLIARWGDESLEIKELLEKGFKSLKVSLIDSATETMAFCESVLKNPDQFVRKHLKGNLNEPRIEINGSSDFGNLPF